MNRAPSTQEIAERAYELYLKNGCREGLDMEHWLTAERQLTVEHMDPHQRLFRAAFLSMMALSGGQWGLRSRT